MAERIDDIAVQEFVNAIKEEPQDTNKTYNATVSRVDKEGIVWVNIHGSDKETPTASTSTEVKRGDNVVVNWRNNKLYIGGNYTNPSAGIGTVQPSIDYINGLVANSITVNSINAATGYIEDLTSKNITTENLAADHATIKELDVESMAAATAYIRDLTSENITADDIIADHATIDTLDSTYATIDELHSDYAEIDLANVNNAWIEYGAMKKAEVFDENVFDLSGNHATLSRIDASKINVANLRADNLVVRRINGQPVVGGYTLIDSNSSGYASKNPQALGWYEFVNAQWVLSTDTTVDMTKAYYQEGDEVSLYDQAYIDGLENDLQQQIDGAVETYTGTVVPTLVNWPYTDWYDTSVTPVHDERAKHVGDIYYVVNSASDENGYCYRFAYDNTTHAYSWVLIKDSDVTKALSDISDLQTFESTTTSWIDETDEGLETIRTNHTALAGVVDKTVKESVQLWFTKANTTAPNKPTAEVTSTSTAGNAWRKVVPAYNASYPNYYYCWQYKFVDDTFGWSDVVRDIAMGETQGVSRDAKNTADAALPASTFQTFESTTFTDLVDEVDEQSTTMTNMTSRLGLNSDGTGASTDIVAKESALEQTVDGISTRVGKTETKLIGMYATSSTAEGTRDKVATITPALPNDAVWELSTGTMVTVKFVNANTYEATSSSPLRLNVNGKGLKPIKTYANGDLSEAEYKWAAGSTFTFVYNGTNWLMQDSSVSVRMNSNETSISQTADSIISLASGNTKYTKPDGTEATSAIGTTVNQTANNVLIKATRTGATTAEQQAGGTSAAALINVTPDTVKIAANHVEIDGTAVFNAVSDSSTASAAMLNSEIEIGGRNILRNSGGDPMFLWATAASNGGTMTKTPNQTVAEWGATDAIRVTGKAGSTSATFGIINTVWASSQIAISDQPYVFSVYVKNNSSSKLDVGFNALASVITVPANTTIRVVSQNAKGNGANVMQFVFVASAASANYDFTYWHPQIEYGNKVTDWAPAPEDVQAEIDAKKSIHTINPSPAISQSYSWLMNVSADGYYRSAGWDVESTDGLKAGDTVRIKMSVSDMSNATVYLVTTVNSVSGNKLYATSHGIDTTVIDGGNILTNSIGANQIKVNELTIGQNQVSGLSTALANTEKLYKHNVDLTGSSYNQDTWYPVLIGECPETDASIYFKCSIVNGGGTPSWSSHSSKHWGCEVEASYSVSNWGWKSDTNSYIDAYTFGQTSTKPIVLSNELSTTAYLVVYLRGGGYYPIQTNIANTPQIKTSSYTINSRTVAPTTTQPVNTANFVISRREGDTKTNEAATKATNYITHIDNNGIRVHPSSTENNSVVINANGMEVFKGGTGSANSVAFYGDTARVGAIANSTSRVETSPTGISFINRNSSGVDKTVFIQPRATEDTTQTKIGTTNAGVFIYDSGTPTTSYTSLGCREVSGSSPSVLTVKYGSVTVSNGNSGTTFEATSRGVETPYSYYSGGYKLITTGTTTKTGSAVAAGSSGEVSVSVAKTGYTPIGLVGWQLTGTNNALLIPFRAYISGTTAYMNVRNTASSSSITPSVTFHVLYIASTQGI